MKKIVSVITLVACMFMAFPAQAQIKFGVKGGLNISKVTFSEDILDGNNRTGFFIGPTAEFTLPLVGLGIDVAALYSQSPSEFRFQGTDEMVGIAGTDVYVKQTLKSIEVPVNVKWTVGLGSTLGVFLAAGPQFGFNVGDGHYANLFDMKKCYTSFNLGGGLKILRHFQLGLNYNFGIGKLAKSIKEESDDKTTDMKKNTWQVSLAYMF